MLRCMRTTIAINDSLLNQAKVRAAESRRSLAAVVEDALRLALASKPVRQGNRKVRVPVSGDGGIMSGVDLDDTAALLDHMESRA